MNPQETFIGEAQELLTLMERGLLSTREHPGDAEAVHAIFRAAHTLKGAAGVFGYEAIVHFAHVAEAVLEEVRRGTRPLDAELVTVLLEAHDELLRLVGQVEAGLTPQANPALLARLEAEAALPADAPHGLASTPTPAPGKVTRYRVAVTFGRGVMTDGFDPLTFVRYLEQLGTLEARGCALDGLPADDTFDPEACYLAPWVVLATAAEPRAIEEVFAFVRETSRVDVTRVDPSGQAPPAGVREAAAARSPARTVKVPAEKLDALVDLIGELVIAGATASATAGRARDGATSESLAALNQLIGSIRETALGLRMVPIGDTFARFHRVVRDVSRQLGKDITLDVRGGDTELDKAMVERLVEPLTHVVRNSLDHGVESKDERRAAGKPEQGHLRLSAAHESGNIVIELRDDGRGLDRPRILKKALEQGLVAAGQQLTEEQIDELIFLPGFTSVDTVSDLSGRGVGMDVVKKTVEELRGTIELLSEPGRGLTVRLRLPLTLAIIDGFMVRAGRGTYVLPQKVIIECLDFDQVLDSEAHHRLNVRGEVVPFLRLREVLRVAGAPPGRENVVMVQQGEQRVGLVVDQLVASSQTVIKPLGPLFRHVRGIAGATILGSGEVGFILDVPQLVRQAIPPRASRVRELRS